ncbi:hypothetical protein GOBAR_DD13840 [Gossypium barbadense]|nr:hypothetical protein GOBAR_DD13840 [Gossypium barbadense]
MIMRAVPIALIASLSVPFTRLGAITRADDPTPYQDALMEVRDLRRLSPSKLARNDCNVACDLLSGRAYPRFSGYDRGGSMRDLILLPEILPSVAVGDNTKMCLTSLILFVAAQKIIERMGNPLLKIRLARQRREIDPSGLGPKVPRFRIDTGDKSTVRPLHQKRFANSAYPELSLLRQAYKPKDLAVPPDLYKSESMAYLTEVTLLRSWTANWLQYVKWYYTQALLPSVLLKDFFDAPVFTRHWKVKSEDPELIRFGLLWRLYDEVAKKGEDKNGCSLFDRPIRYSYLLASSSISSDRTALNLLDGSGTSSKGRIPRKRKTIHGVTSLRPALDSGSHRGSCCRISRSYAKLVELRQEAFRKQSYYRCPPKRARKAVPTSCLKPPKEQS